MQKNFSAVIMAGGTGTRLWPKSRAKKPKQLASLINEDSMIVNTIKRLRPILPDENIYIATNKEQADEIKKLLPEFSKNIIVEPCVRNTGPCIGLAALKLKDTSGPIAFLPADHYIAKEDAFRTDLKKAADLAEQGYLTLVGIRPTEPNPGLGYIKMGKQINDTAYRVEKFTEKPTLEVAQKFLESGQYLWNGGMFIGKSSLILDLLKIHSPELWEHLEKIDQNPESLDTEYEKMENISFDYAVAEKAEKVAVVPGDFGWSDIGNWATLLDVLSKEENENIIVGCEHYGVDTEGCLIHGTERMVATIGLKDVIVVDTPDVVLVCKKDRAQDVKKIVEELKNKGKEKFL